MPGQGQRQLRPRPGEEVARAEAGQGIARHAEREAHERQAQRLLRRVRRGALIAVDEEIEGQKGHEQRRHIPHLAAVVHDLQQVPPQLDGEALMRVEGQHMGHQDRQRAEKQPGHPELPDLFAEKGAEAPAVDIDIARREGKQIEKEGLHQPVPDGRHEFHVLRQHRDHAEALHRIDPFDTSLFHVRALSDSSVFTLSQTCPGPRRRSGT